MEVGNVEFPKERQEIETIALRITSKKALKLITI